MCGGVGGGGEGGKGVGERYVVECGKPLSASSVHGCRVSA